MKANDMKYNIAYKAISESTDGTIRIGQLMWLSSNGELNLPDINGGGALLESEWRDKRTVDFEVEEANNYVIIVEPGRELLKLLAD